MIGVLLSSALAFEPATVVSAPVAPSATLSEQLVLSKTTLSFTRLDLGTPVVTVRDRFSFGLTGRVAVAHIAAPGRPSHTDLRTLGAGLWFGWQASDTVRHDFGVTAHTPVPGFVNTYALFSHEAAFGFGTSYRVHAEVGSLDLDVGADVGFSYVTILSGALSVNGTWRVVDDRVGLMMGGLVGTSDFIWLTPGVRFAPVPQLEVGVTGLVGMPVFGRGALHVSPLAMVKVQLPDKSLVEVR